MSTRGSILGLIGLLAACEPLDVAGGASHGPGGKRGSAVSVRGCDGRSAVARSWTRCTLPDDIGALQPGVSTALPAALRFRDEDNHCQFLLVSDTDCGPMLTSFGWFAYDGAWWLDLDGASQASLEGPTEVSWTQLDGANHVSICTFELEGCVCDPFDVVFDGNSVTVTPGPRTACE